MDGIVELLAILLAVVPYISSQIAGCPNGLSSVTELLVTNDKYCYYFGQKNTTWNLAQSDCQRNGGDLAAIDSAESQKFLDEYGMVITDEGESADVAQYWIGGTYRRGEITHTWITGDNTTYSNWQSGHPNPRANQECLLLALDFDSKWITADCNSAIWFYGYICRYDKVDSGGSGLLTGPSAFLLSSIVVLAQLLTQS